MAASCEQRLRFKAIGNPGRFDEATVTHEVAAECAPLKEAGATAALFGQTLGDYAAALVKLADTRPTVFDDDIKAVSGAAAKLEHRDGTAVFDSGKLGAAGKLARAAAALLMQQRTARLTRATLAGDREALVTVVGAMKSYADWIYAHQVSNAQDVLKVELARLEAASVAPTQADVDARLPWRYAQFALRDDIAANAAALRRVDAFDKAADALLAAHAALIDDFDKLDGASRLAQVSAFVAQVQAIEDDVGAL